MNSRSSGFRCSTSRQALKRERLRNDSAYQAGKIGSAASQEGTASRKCVVLCRSSAVLRDWLSENITQVATGSGSKKKPNFNASLRANMPSANGPRPLSKPPAHNTHSRRKTLLPVKIQLSVVSSNRRTRAGSTRPALILGHTAGRRANGRLVLPSISTAPPQNRPRSGLASNRRRAVSKKPGRTKSSAAAGGASERRFMAATSLPPYISSSDTMG